MTKDDALKFIDDHKSKLINPVEMLHWAWLRVTILNVPDEAWERAEAETLITLAN